MAFFSFLFFLSFWPHLFLCKRCYDYDDIYGFWDAFFMVVFRLSEGVFRRCFFIFQQQLLYNLVKQR